MAALPIECKLAKLILLGHVFDKLRDCIIIAAGLSVKSIFESGIGTALETYGYAIESN